VDFGELPVFGEIIAYPLILIFKKEKTESQQFLFAPIEHLDFITLSQEVTQVGKYIDQSVLQNQSWMLTGNIEQRVFEKISNGSDALSNYLGCKKYRGILTGL
jgi:hypothetical protein